MFLFLVFVMLRGEKEKQTFIHLERKNRVQCDMMRWLNDNFFYIYKEHHCFCIFKKCRSVIEHSNFQRQRDRELSCIVRRLCSQLVQYIPTMYIYILYWLSQLFLYNVHK